MSRVASAADYLQLWTDICSRRRDAGVRSAYFHHAERFSDGLRIYCRDDIQTATQAILGVFQPHEIRNAHAFSSAGDDGALLLSCRFSMEVSCRRFASNPRLRFEVLNFAVAANGRIQREWVFSDRAAIREQMGPDGSALLNSPPPATRPPLPVFTGQVKLPEAPPLGGDPSALPPACARVLLLLQRIWNERDFGLARSLYAPRAVIHNPGGRRLPPEKFNQAHALRRLLSALPDARWLVEWVCAGERGEDLCLLWRMMGHRREGDATGAIYASFSGITHYRLREGRVLEEWTLFDDITRPENSRARLWSNARLYAPSAP